MYSSNLDVSICRATFGFLLNLASMIVLTIYGHITRFSWQETRVKSIFGSRLRHVINCKLGETKISLQFILFINVSSIPQNHKKNGC